MVKTIKRSVPFTLRFSNTAKLEVIDATAKEYRRVTNYFLGRLQKGEELTEEFLKRFSTPLSYRYKQCAKRQALAVQNSWERRWKKRLDKIERLKRHNPGSKRIPEPPKPPRLRKPAMVLDERFITVEKGVNSFDYWARIATINKGRPILVPVRSYRHANGYIDDWKLLGGGRLVRKNGTWTLILTFEKKVEQRGDATPLGVDIGYRKLITTSDAEVIGGGIKSTIERAARKKKGSRAERAARQQIRCEIGHAVNRLPEKTCMVVEDLKNLKKGKKRVWNRKVNNKFNYWYYSLVLKRIEERCEVAGVQCHRVPPANTSRDCPLCGHLDELNREGESFRCLGCGFSHDADYVGSLNVLSRFTGEPVVPRSVKPELVFVP